MEMDRSTRHSARQWVIGAGDRTTWRGGDQGDKDVSSPEPGGSGTESPRRSGTGRSRGSEAPSQAKVVRGAKWDRRIVAAELNEIWRGAESRSRQGRDRTSAGQRVRVVSSALRVVRGADVTEPHRGGLNRTRVGARVKAIRFIQPLSKVSGGKEGRSDLDGERRIVWGPRPLYVWRSFQRFGQLTWSKSRDRPGQGFLGPAREHSTSRGKGTPSSHQGCCVRLEADNPHFQIGSVTYTTSNTPIGRQTGGGRDEGLT